ncbi:hypothetical protein QIW46_16315 [Pseudomonas fluorescens]|uniref:hypothetical protein n=1 Tax=Pseudomonas fluorescens group TaxID=136843 RepID=UPI0010C0DF61|nr:hypothetical protein [Pseudomonas koreensis]TKJ83984.1 hypothetical protein PkoCFBP13504_13945 [Pseudomonas koreensis]
MTEIILKQLKTTTDTVWHFYKTKRLLFLIFSAVLFLAIGYISIGPFLVSDAYQWFYTLVQNNAVLKDLVNLNEMIRDKLIATTLPFFILWSCVLFIYLKNKERADTINYISSYLSFLTGGTAFFTIVLGCTLLGSFSYALQKIETSIYTPLLILLSLSIIAMGFYMRHVMKLVINPNSKTDCLAPLMLKLCIIASIAIYLYGLFNDPLKLLTTIIKHYPGK